MEQVFSLKEKRNYRFLQHIKNHSLEYALDIVGPVLFTLMVLYLCRAERIMYGLLLAAAYAVGKVAYRLYHYKKEFIDVDVK